ncbi:uncharacterized protein LOC105392121 [Plutella xylostella]|uniref:uncharacterized protein LOC105392121 n=1 Tax=Plutella xylostella TaxID=51655 RepID=UPI0020327CD8|nr:uncharacterized protein LOC105392121 [Plutella xylostella]
MMRASNILRYLSCGRKVNRKAPDAHLHCGRRHTITRHYADAKKPPKSEPASIQTTTTTDTSERLRVRRARPGDAPRVVRFVREHAGGWPGAPPARAAAVALADLVARALAQGHSMLAEQQERQAGWARVRGVAIGAAACPWDAALLARWGRCLRAAPARDLVAATAHCLRAPKLHEKYRVHNILQMTLIVPDGASSPELVRLLVGQAIKRGRDAGFPLLRFDVTNAEAAKALESLNLTKEWENTFSETNPKPDSTAERNNIFVYSVFTNPSIVNDSNESSAK